MNSLSHFSRRLNNLFLLSKDLFAATNLVWKLQGFFRNSVTIEETKAKVKERTKLREDNFLAIARKAIFRRPENPYRKLLALAGCEYGDLDKIVKKDGVEGALRVLFRNGVYLTVDEFKGRRSVVRGSFKMDVHPGLLHNPFTASHLHYQSGGSRGPRTPASLDLTRMRDEASHRQFTVQSPFAGKLLTGLWMGPGGPDLKLLLIFCCMGHPPVRWFLRAGDPSQQSLFWRFRTKLMRYVSLPGGARIPEPTYVPHDDPLPIAHWMAEVLRSGNTPFLHAFASSTVRLCQAAQETGIDLKGAKFSMGGEPTTNARLAVIERIGAEGIPVYASIETGVIGTGCFEPEAADDVHMFHDLYAVIHPEGNGENIPPKALFITSVEKNSPFIMLNLSMGDEAVITKRNCGCMLQSLGWETHLHTIRSYEKLTTGGLTMLDYDVIGVLEELLPARFGGGPTDFQLLEDESEGQPSLTLLVSPAIGQIDTNEIREAFLEGIRASNSGLWRTPGFFSVDRRKPISTVSGKIQHLHAGRSAKP